MKTVKAGDKLICISNEGYWSIGDIRRVQEIDGAFMKVDNHWIDMLKFRWNNYRIANWDFVIHLINNLRHDLKNKSSICIEHTESAILYQTIILCSL